VRLETDPPFCVVPSGSYKPTSEKAVNYYKVLQLKDKRRHYICSLREDELEEIKNGFPAYKLLNEKGIVCLPAKPKPAKLPRSRREYWSIGYVLFGMEIEIRACVFKHGSRAYVYVKTFNKTENGKKLKYVGAVLAEQVWQDDVKLGLYLQKHGYLVLIGIHNVHPEQKRKPIERHAEPPSTANVESEAEWVGYEMEAGDPQAILNHYWDATEFLEACPNDEETARELYGDDQVDEYFGKRKRSIYDRDEDSEDE
jgi:hypothetical protein